MLKDIKEKVQSTIKNEAAGVAEMGVDVVKSTASGFINMVLRKIFIFLAIVVVFIAVVFVGSSYISSQFSNNTEVATVEVSNNY